MASQNNTSQASFLEATEEEFLAKMKDAAKFKERSHNTYHDIHLPELNTRLNLQLNLPKPPEEYLEDDPFASRSDLSNTSKVEIVYLGNSMLERLKTTGQDTHLGKLACEGTAWNAGCGGDKNENVLYRLMEGMYDILQKVGKDIKLWVLASGTNNLHPKRGFRESDLKSYRLLLEACLRIAPGSRVLACDVFYRKDIPDGVVDESNEKLKAVVGEVNRELVSAGHGERVVWVEARRVVGKDLLVDHVHLTEEGYTRWDEVLWPMVGIVFRTQQGPIIPCEGYLEVGIDIPSLL